MLGYYEVREYYTLWKLMIDEKYQNKGYGKKALRLGIDYLVNHFKVKEECRSKRKSHSDTCCPSWASLFASNIFKKVI